MLKSWLQAPPQAGVRARVQLSPVEAAGRKVERSRERAVTHTCRRRVERLLEIVANLEGYAGGLR